MNWSKEQLEILEGAGNMLVSASAGSGKTTVMIERIRRLIERGESLKNMVICTYTIAAAADMKYKLAAALTKSGADRELEYLPQADISTLHSFCSRLVKSYFYVTDADPAFELLGEGEAAALKNECLTTVLERASGERFALFYDALIENRADRRLRRLIDQTYAYACIQPDPDGWLEHCLDLYDRPEEVRARLETIFLDRRQSLARAVDALTADTGAAGFTRNIPACAALSGWLNGGSEPPVLRGRIPDGFAALNERYGALKKAVKALLEEEAAALSAPEAGEAREEAALVVSLARDFKREYAESKRRRGKLDFNDLEHLALGILKSEAADEINARIRYVFVDEYQDINPLQEEIVNLLARRAELFEVGDLKQSIYAFRLCEPRIFADKYRRYSLGEGGRAIDLNANYRSFQGVIDGVNRVFDDAMTARFGGVDYRSARLECGLKTDGEPVRLKLIEPPPPPDYTGVYSVRNDRGAAGRRRAAAYVVAADIVDLLSGTTADGDSVRPVRPSDIAVIARSRSGALGEVYAALRELRVPAAFAMKSRWEDSRAVRPLVNLLRLVDNRTDDVMLAATLKSPFGGFTDDELAAIRLSGEGTFCGAFEAYKGPLSSRILEFTQKLDRYERTAAGAPAEEIAGIAVSEAEYFEYLYSLDGGAREAAELSAFLDYVSGTGANVPELLDLIDAEPERDSAEDTGDTVRLMTAHAAKGLEFRYVLFVGAERRFRLDETGGTILLDRETGLSIRKFDYGERTAEKTKLYLLAAAGARKRMLEEELRILYVAMTRAKEKLYIYAEGSRERTAGEPTCPLDWLYPLGPERVAAADAPPPARAVPDETPVDRALVSAIAAKLAFVYPRPHLPQKTAVTALAEAADDETTATYETAGTDRERAAEIGTAYHLMMEHVDFFGDFEAEWERLSDRFPAEAALCDPERIGLAVKAMRTLAAGRRIYREQPFILDEGGTLVQGVIDLLLIGEGGSVVVDYKTTRSRDLRTPAYKFQTGMYASAVRRLLKIPVERVYLYSFFTDSLVEMEAGDDAECESF